MTTVDWSFGPDEIDPASPSESFVKRLQNTNGEKNSTYNLLYYYFDEDILV